MLEKSGMLWDKQHKDNTTFVERRTSELIEVTNVKSLTEIILCGSPLKLVLRVSPRCFEIQDVLLPY